jgi:hypothetical protein
VRVAGDVLFVINIDELVVQHRPIQGRRHQSERETNGGWELLSG